MQNFQTTNCSHLLKRGRQCIVMIDLVESVRLIMAQEEDSIRRWLNIVAFVKSRLAETGKARIVRSQGDGILLTFDDAPAALALALACTAFSRDLNAPGCRPNSGCTFASGPRWAMC